MRIACEGSHLREVLNGEEVVAVDLDEWDAPGRGPDGSDNEFAHAWSDAPRCGRVGLQDHGGEVRFRTVRVRER